MVLCIKNLVSYFYWWDKTDQKAMGHNNQYQHINIDFFDIIQLPWEIEWIIAGDEAHYNDILTGENVSWAF